MRQSAKGKATMKIHLVLVVLSAVVVTGCTSSLLTRDVKGEKMNEEKPCIAILEGTLGEGGINSPEFKEYSKRSNANGEAHGGVVLQKYMVSENLGQGGKPDFILIVKYPSYEAAKNTFSNEEYKAILPLRDVAFKEVKILLTK